MIEEYCRLTEILCVVHGWCGSVVDGEYRRVDDYLPISGPVTAEQFAEWVILAEGQDPDGAIARAQGWRATIENVFVECIGARVFDAQDVIEV